MHDEENYDLILSNPPFYTEDYKTGDDHRDQARFAEALPLDELLEGASLLLSKNGRFDMIIPFSEEETAIKIAQSHKLYPTRITRVKCNFIIFTVIGFTIIMLVGEDETIKEILCWEMFEGYNMRSRPTVTG